ncbi:hypothetical protein ACFX2I_036128 [Malus domestica]
MAVARLSTTKTARRALSEVCLARPRSARQKACPSEPEKKAEVRQIPSTDAILPGELCARLPGDSCDEHSFGTPGGIL